LHSICTATTTDDHEQRASTDEQLGNNAVEEVTVMYTLYAEYSSVERKRKE
jgi:hypothetical protein